MHFGTPLGDNRATLGAKHETELDGHLICRHSVQPGSHRGDGRLDLIDRGFHRFPGVRHHLPGSQACRRHQTVRQIILVDLDEQRTATHYRHFHHIRHRSHHGEPGPLLRRTRPRLLGSPKKRLTFPAITASSRQARAGLRYLYYPPVSARFGRRMLGAEGGEVGCRSKHPGTPGSWGHRAGRRGGSCQLAADRHLRTRHRRGTRSP